MGQISGGTIANAASTSTGSGSFQVNNNGNLSGSTLSSGSQLNILGNNSLTITNGITNNGTIVVNSNYSGNPAYLVFSGSQTLGGSGSVVLNGHYGQQYALINTANNGDLLTQAAGHTISGFGQINAALNNLGTVDALNGLTLAGPVTQVSGSTLTGGTWIAEANSTLNISSAGTLSTNAGNVILNGPGAGFTNITPLTVNQGSFAVQGGGSFATAGDLLNSGTLLAAGSSTLAITGARRPGHGRGLERGRRFDQRSGGADFRRHAHGRHLDRRPGVHARDWLLHRTTNQGTVVLNGAGSTLQPINALANNQGSFSILGGRSFTTTGDLTNSGTLRGRWQQLADGAADACLPMFRPT